MPETFSPPPWVSNPDMHRSMYVTHMPWCIPGSLINGFPWSRWRGKRSRHSRCMCSPQFYVFVKKPMANAHGMFWVQIHASVWSSEKLRRISHVVLSGIRYPLLILRFCIVSKYVNCAIWRWWRSLIFSSEKTAGSLWFTVNNTMTAYDLAKQVNNIQ